MKNIFILIICFYSIQVSFAQKKINNRITKTKLLKLEMLINENCLFEREKYPIQVIHFFNYNNKTNSHVHDRFKETDGDDFETSNKAAYETRCAGKDCILLKAKTYLVFFKISNLDTTSFRAGRFGVVITTKNEEFVYTTTAREFNGRGGGLIQSFELILKNKDMEMYKKIVAAFKELL